MPQLTDAACRAAKPIGTLQKLADGQGLYLDVFPNGSKLWRFRFRHNGKQQTISMGAYPDVPLAVARKQLFEARALLALGVHPSAPRRQNAKGSKNTFEAIFKQWLEKKKEEVTPRTAGYIERRVETNILPSIGSCPINGITTPQVLDCLRAVENRGVRDTTHKIKQYVSAVFDFAIASGLAVNNPAASLSAKVLKPKKRGHFPALTIKELPQFLVDLSSNKGRLFPVTLLAIELMMLTFVRTKELLGAEWKEFEGATWEIPASRMKSRRPHVVPLSRQVLAALDKLRLAGNGAPYLFPSPTKHAQPISNAAILSGLASMGYKGVMTGHGFRALATGVLKEQLDWRHEVVDLQLAHLPLDEVGRAYDRALYLEKRRQMMQEWADYLERVRIEALTFRAPNQNPNACP